MLHPLGQWGSPAIEGTVLWRHLWISAILWRNCIYFGWCTFPTLLGKWGQNRYNIWTDV